MSSWYCFVSSLQSSNCAVPDPGRGLPVGAGAGEESTLFLFRSPKPRPSPSAKATTTKVTTAPTIQTNENLFVVVGTGDLTSFSGDPVEVVAMADDCTTHEAPTEKPKHSNEAKGVLSTCWQAIRRKSSDGKSSTTPPSLCPGRRRRDTGQDRSQAEELSPEFSWISVQRTAWPWKQFAESSQQTGHT